MSEYCVCSKCGKIRQLLYDYHYEPCCLPKDKLIEGKKPLDWAINNLPKFGNKGKNHAKDQSSVSKVPKPIKTSDEG